MSGLSNLKKIAILSPYIHCHHRRHSHPSAYPLSQKQLNQYISYGKMPVHLYILAAQTPHYPPVNTPKLEVFHSSVQQNSPTSDQIVPSVTISFTPTNTSNIQLKFDLNNTIMTEYQSNAGNTLSNLDNLTLTITNPDQDDDDDNNQDNTDQITYTFCNQACNSYYDCKADSSLIKTPVENQPALLPHSLFFSPPTSTYAHPQHNHTTLTPN